MDKREREPQEEQDSAEKLVGERREDKVRCHKGLYVLWPPCNPRKKKPQEEMKRGKGKKFPICTDDSEKATRRYPMG